MSLGAFFKKGVTLRGEKVDDVMKDVVSRMTRLAVLASLYNEGLVLGYLSKGETPPKIDRAQVVNVFQILCGGKRKWTRRKAREGDSDAEDSDDVEDGVEAEEDEDFLGLNDDEVWSEAAFTRRFVARVPAISKTNISGNIFKDMVGLTQRP